MGGSIQHVSAVKGSIWEMMGDDTDVLVVVDIPVYERDVGGGRLLTDVHQCDM